MCLVIDVGLTSSNSGFSDTAFQLASAIVQRKIYASEPDHFGVVLLGSKGTSNALGRSNITVARYNES